MLKISNTADWQAVEAELRQYLRGLGNNADAMRIISGLRRQLDALGNIEVEQRRRNRILPQHTEMVDRINANLLELEKLIVLAKLYS